MEWSTNHSRKNYAEISIAPKKSWKSSKRLEQKRVWNMQETKTLLNQQMIEIEYQIMKEQRIENLVKRRQKYKHN